MEAQLIVKFTQEGWHCWPEAPPSRSYLASRHRHIFHIRVGVPTPIDDKRSIEFHDLLAHSKVVFRDIAKRGTLYDFGTMSCESMASVMALRLCRFYDRSISVLVSEDNECGASVTAQPSDLPEIETTD